MEKKKFRVDSDTHRVVPSRRLNTLGKHTRRNPCNFVRAAHCARLMYALPTAHTRVFRFNNVTSLKYYYSLDFLPSPTRHPSNVTNLVVRQWVLSSSISCARYVAFLFLKQRTSTSTHPYNSCRYTRRIIIILISTHTPHGRTTVTIRCA